MIAATAETEIVWDQLKELVGRGRVIPIVGPELLVPPGSDPAQALPAILARRLAEQLLPDEAPVALPTLHEVACRFQKANRDLSPLYPRLNRLMPGEGDIEIPEPLRQLASIGSLKLFVTICIDPLLERAFDGRCRSMAFSPERPIDLPQRFEDLDEPLVFHLMGALSAADSYAVTEEDYLEFVYKLHAMEHQLENLFDALRMHSVLMLGCGFPDWLARFFLRLAKHERFPYARRKIDFVVESDLARYPRLASFLDHFGGATKIVRGFNSAELVATLAEHFQASADETETSPAVPDREAPQGAVFISYAHEDRDAARALRGALEQAEIDVWMDEERLEGGDLWNERIRRAIESASLFIPLFSEHTLTPKRRFFRTEWDYALTERRRASPTRPFVLPVAIDIIDPGAAEIPQGFREAHWESLSGGQVGAAFVQRVLGLYRQYQLDNHP